MSQKKQDDSEALKAFLARFNTQASVEHKGKTYRIPEEAFPNFKNPIQYFHPDGPSSWLTSSVVSYVSREFGKTLPREKIIALSALACNTTVDAIEDALDWNANYMAWHDGGSPEENHSLPKTK